MKKSLSLFNALFDKNEAKFLKLAKSGKFPLIETDPFGRGLLSCAVIAEMPEAVNYLLEQKAGLDGVDSKGWTALHFAAYCNNVPIVQQLLTVFPDIDVKDSNGNTPLWRAVYEEHPEMVAFLAGQGADPGLKNNNGDSPLVLAKEIGVKELIEPLSN